MDYSNIDSWNVKELKEEAYQLKLKWTGAKTDMIASIRSERDKLYEKLEKLGDPGKDAITYAVKVKGSSRLYAMKLFKPRKVASRILREAEFQRRLASYGVCPKIIDVETTLKNKYIVMEKLDKHLIDITGEKEISLDHQKQLVKLYKKLDDIGIFHGDANPLNYMTKGKKLYVIDFGMSKEITPQLLKQLKTNHPNLRLMTLAMSLKLKSMDYPKESYEYLVEQLTSEQREQFDL